MILHGKRGRTASRTMWSGWPYLAVLIVSFFIGVFAGVSFAFFVEPSEALSDYLHEYCALLSEGEFQISFLSAVWDCVRWPLLTVLLGITVLGVVGIPALFVVRGFIVSFSICTFALLLGQRGIAVAAVLFAVLVLLVLPVLFILGCSGLRGACLHLPGAIPSAGKQYRAETLLVCSGILAVSAAIQWTVVPSVLSVICSRLAF